MKRILFSAAALAALAFASCDDTNKTGNVTGDADTAVLMDKNAVNPKPGDPTDNKPNTFSWDNLDWQAPVVKYDEMTDKDVEIRGNDGYGIYSLGENVLFATGSADIQAGAKGKLDNVINSIKAHYAGAHVGVYGFTDATGSASANQDLSQKRAAAVKDYIVSKGMDGGMVEVRGMGETAPVATNSTDAGKQANRRVQIVAKK